MSLVIHKTERFAQDADVHFEWYRIEASEDVAWKFEHALDATLRMLAGQPAMGRCRNFRSPELRDVRSFRVESPFGKLLVFYRIEGEILVARRLMHGARDLPRRLVEPPGSK